MEWLKQMNEAMAYIEEHLTEELNINQIAVIAGCPAYYFQKIFTYMTGISFSEYIRRRKMSLAAVELQNTNATVIDISLKYGYDSPTAFNRAFQKIHGVAPSLIKKSNITIKSYPPYQFSLNIQGANYLTYQIVSKRSFRILGKRCPLYHDLMDNFERIPKEWDMALAHGILDQLQLLNDQSPHALLGVSIHHTREWYYMISVATNKESDAFEEYQFPQATWAVFKGTGTNRSLQELEKQVILNWLPTSGYVYADLPDIEVYLKADPHDMIYEYWLPVRLQQEE